MVQVLKARNFALLVKVERNFYQKEEKIKNQRWLHEKKLQQKQEKLSCTSLVRFDGDVLRSDVGVLR